MSLEKDKLLNLPKIYWINIDGNKERKEKYLSNVNNFNIKNQRVQAITPDVIRDKCVVSDIIFAIKMRVRTGCCTASHLRAMQTFINDKDNKDDYCLISEDDLSFETVNYWKNNWTYYFNKLPKDFDIVKLDITSVYDNLVKYTNKYFHNPVPIQTDMNELFGSSTCLYIITRKSAQYMVDNYILDGKYNIPKLGCGGSNIYTKFKNVYFYPLFTYRISIPSNIRGNTKKFDKCAQYFLNYIKNNAI